MALNKSNLNSAFALAKNKQGEWVVGMWANQALYSVDGENTKLCKFKEMTKWRYFREAGEHTSLVELQKGDRVFGENGEWYYVIDHLSSKDGEFVYLTGV